MEVYAPGTWSIPGGKIDDGESILDGAIREAEEEVGYDGDLNVERLSVFREGDFEFHTFLGAVPDEFEPSLNWENDDHTWTTIDSMPSPLHFGVQAMLKSVPKKVLMRRIDKVCRL
jgi:8-oxo-dGTP pyrophosphatase MutT (NUDIX family)